MGRNNLIQIRQGTAIAWSGNNPTLGNGEPGFDNTNNILKIGDGSKNWNNLTGVSLNTSGTTNFIPVFQSDGSFGDSIINESGNTIGINTPANGVNLTIHAKNLGSEGSLIINENAEGNSSKNVVFEARESGVRLGAMYSYGTAYSGGSIAAVGSGGTAFTSITGPVTIAPLDANKPLILGGGINRYATIYASEFRINPSGLNQDFIIQGDSDQELFVTDASTDRVGIGTGVPEAKLHVSATTGEGTIISQTYANNSWAGLLVRNEYNQNVASFQYGNSGVTSTGLRNTVLIGSRQSGVPVKFYQGKETTNIIGANGAFEPNNERIIFDVDGNTILTAASGQHVLVTGANAFLDVQGSGSFRCPSTGLGLQVVNSGGTGLLFGEIAFGNYGGSYAGTLYNGMTHTDLDGDDEYMILSKGDHTYISAQTGSASIIRGGANHQTYQLIAAPTYLSVGQYSEKMKFDSSKVEFNVSGQNLDFVVQGNSLPYLFYVDASTDNIGINRNNPATKLHISESSTYTSENTYAIKISDGADPETMGLLLGVDTGNSIAAIQANDPGTHWNRNISMQAMGGKLGVATVNPTDTLSVSGTTRVQSLNINGAFTLPTGDGSDGQAMVTDGAGNLSFANVSGAGGGGSGISDIVEDTTPQLGGNLDLNGKTLVAGQHQILVSHTGISLTGINLIYDGFQIASVQDCYRVGNDSNDGLLIEKVDGNSTNVDGGIIFANRGSGGISNPSLSINGFGDVAIGKMVSPFNQGNKLSIDSGNFVFNSSNGNYDFIVSGTGSHPLIYVDPDSGTGRVGIGRKPDNYVLDVSGSTRVSPLSGATHFFTVNNTANNELFVVKPSATVINENGDNHDFRVEGDSDVNLFKTKASTDNVTIGATPEFDYVKFLLYSYDKQYQQIIGGGSSGTSLLVNSYINTGVSSATAFYSYTHPVSGASLNSLIHFRAQRPASSGTVTTERGFYTDVHDGTNNRGFEGHVPTGDGNYNLYMEGSGKNYLAGNLGVGTDSPSGLLHTKAPDNESNFFIQEGSREIGSAQFLQKTHGYVSAGGLISYATGYVAGSLASVGSGGAALTNMGEFPLAIAPLYTSQPILFGAGNDEYMRSQNGNLMIGRQASHEFTGFNTLSIDGANGSFIDLYETGTARFRLQGDATYGALQTLTAIPIRFSTDQTERMRIDESGNVGIGTSSPQAKLDVSGTVRFNDLVRWEYPDKALDTAIDDLGYLRFYDESNGIAGMGVSTSSFNIGTTGAINLRFIGQEVELARFDTAGNFIFNDGLRNCDFRIAGDTDANLIVSDASADKVGIGTSSPAYKLDVVGNVQAQGSFARFRAQDLPVVAKLQSSSGDLAALVGAESNHDLYLTTDNIARMIIASGNGNVGINRSATSRKLTIKGNSLDNTAAILIQPSGLGTDTTDGLLLSQNNAGLGYLWNFENKGLVFATNNLERMRISESGNVGIGTSSPTGTLTIHPAETGNHILEIARNANKASIKAVGGGNTTTNQWLVMDSAGRGSGDYASINHFVNDNVLLAYGGGNVGIGTSSPAHKLDVNGMIRSVHADGACGLIVEDTGGSGVHIGDCAFHGDTYAGIKHSAHTGSSEYMMISRGDHTIISAKAGYGTIIRGGNNNASSEIRVYDATNGTDGVVINENGSDVDMRIEGTGDPNLFKVDASVDSIGIGTATPAYKLDVSGETRIMPRPSPSGHTLYLGRHPYQASIKAEGSGEGTNNNWLIMDSAGSGNSCALNYFTDDDVLLAYGGGNVGVGTIDPGSHKFRVFGGSAAFDGGHVTINDNAGNYDFRVEGQNDNSLFWTDANLDAIGIGRTAIANYKLSIYQDKNLSDLSAAGTARGIAIDCDHVFDAVSRLNYSHGLEVSMAQSVNHGVTNSGYCMAIDANGLINGSGTIVGAYGLRTYAGGHTSFQSSGVINESFGIRNRVLNLGSGEMTTAYGLYSEISSGSGTYGGSIQNAYHIRLRPTSEVATSNKFGMYQEGTDDKNYFAGNVGLGTTTPLHPLHVVGTGRINSLNVNGNFTFPSVDGSNGQVLTTDGNGAVTWTNQSGGGGGTDTFTTGIVFNTGDKSLVLNRSGGSVTGTLTNVLVSGNNVSLLNNDAGYLSNIVEDTSPQLGGNLQLESKDIIGTGNMNIVGTITGTSVTLGAAGTQHLSIIRDGGGSFGNTVVTDLLGDITIAAQNTKIKMSNPALGGQSVITMNPDAANQDFIVKGDDDVNLFVVDANTDRIGIGTNLPTHKLDVVYPDGHCVRFADSGGSGILIGDCALSGNAAFAGIKHTSMSGTNDYMMISALGNTFISASDGNTVFIRGGGNAAESEIRVLDAGAGGVGIVFNEAGSDRDIRMEGAGDINLFRLDASTDRIGIGTATPTYKLDVSGTINASTELRASGHPAIVSNTGVATGSVRISNIISMPSGTYASLSSIDSSTLYILTSG